MKEIERDHAGENEVDVWSGGALVLYSTLRQMVLHHSSSLQKKLSGYRSEALTLKCFGFRRRLELHWTLTFLGLQCGIVRCFLNGKGF